MKILILKYKLILNKFNKFHSMFTSTSPLFVILKLGITDKGNKLKPM